MHYAPSPTAVLPIPPHGFVIAVTGLDHNHIDGMTTGLLDAGATLKWVHDPDPGKTALFATRYPGVSVARNLEEILKDPEVVLVASAAIPRERTPIGLRVMAAGKDYFTAKAACTTLDQLAQANRAVASTGRKFAIYYSERLHVQCALRAGQLVRAGAIGRVIQMMGLGPHRLRKSERPDWFFNKDLNGGILSDIGVHQFEQFLHYTGATDATITHALTRNHNNPDRPAFEDFGEAALIGNNGATGYLRVDWFTPDGLSTWGDGRTFLLGTKGYIELRKYVDAGHSSAKDNLLLVDDIGERFESLAMPPDFPYFRQLMQDCLLRSDIAIPQAHVFKATELALKAQAFAESNNPLGLAPRSGTDQI